MDSHVDIMGVLSHVEPCGKTREARVAVET